MSTFNFINSHELAGMFGSDVGVLKGTNTYIIAKIEKLEEGMGVSHQAIKTIVEKVGEQDEAIIKVEKDIDKLNARVVHIEYHRQWEIRKKIAQTRAKLIREKIWKENVNQ
jgi:uncharacterized protein YoxC